MDRIYMGVLAGGTGIGVAIGLGKMVRDMGRCRNDRFKAPWEREG